jgi:hypothetical protein
MKLYFDFGSENKNMGRKQGFWVGSDQEMVRQIAIFVLDPRTPLHPLV